MTDIYEHRDEDADEAEKFLDKDNLKNLPVIGKYFEKKPKVAVLRLAGVIADDTRRGRGISHARYARLIEKAFDKADKAVAIVINSPGGAPAQAELIGAHIRRCARDKQLPVIAFVEDVAASGGYWLACAADGIYAQNTSIVGSIGVISAGFGFDRLIGKLGVHRRVHTAGEDKAFLDPFLPEKEDDVTRLKDLQKDMHNVFIDWVKERRGKRLRAADEILFSGAFWTAGPAMDHGLIDGIADMRGYMQEKYGKDVKFIELAPEKRILSLPYLPGLKGADLAGGFVEAVETETTWQRYGL